MKPRITSRHTCSGKVVFGLCGLAAVPKIRGTWTLLGAILDPGMNPPDLPDGIRYSARRTWFCHDIIVPTVGKQEPQSTLALELIDAVKVALTSDEPAFLFHCHLGRSRSVAAAAIALATIDSRKVHEIPELLGELSPRAWPNRLMLLHADRALGLGGALLDAGTATKQITARRYPEWVKTLRTIGFGTDVDEVSARREVGRKNRTGG